MLMLTITTERLLIREYKESDFEELKMLLSDSETMRFWPQPFDDDQVHRWLERSIRNYRDLGYGRWAVFLKANRKFVGDCGFMRYKIIDRFENDLGYIIHHPYWHQGYGYEAAKACLEYGFSQLKFDSVCANMAHDHLASQKVAEKLGMKREAQFMNPRNRNLLTYVYRISRNEASGKEGN